MRIKVFTICLFFTYLNFAQQFEIDFGVNIVAPSNIIIISPFGLRASGSLTFDNYSFRTNLSLNYHSSFHKSDDFIGLGDAFFTQIEESIIYQSDENFNNIYIGVGLGYYSLLENDNSAHVSEQSPGIWVDNYGFDSNIGFNLLVGKDIGIVIIELKYIYTSFNLEQYYYSYITKESGIRVIDYSFHAINLSVGF